MRVTQGWSGEVKGVWAKIYVELGEEDLFRLLQKSTEVKPDALTTGRAFQLLEAESEILILVKLIESYGYDYEEGKKRIAELRDRQETLYELLGRTTP